MEYGVWNFRIVETRLESVPVSTEQGPRIMFRFFVFFAFVQLGLFRQVGSRKNALYIAAFLPTSKGGPWEAIGSDVACEIAIDDVNSTPTLLKDYELRLRTNDTKVVISNRSTVYILVTPTFFSCDAAVFSRQSWLSALRPIERRRKICCFGGSGMHACDRSGI